MIKLSFIRKLPNGKYRVVSKKGRNLGTYTTLEEAKERLRMVEWFKHKSKFKKKASETTISTNLNSIKELTYSEIHRQLRQSGDETILEGFRSVFKFYFDLYCYKYPDKCEIMAISKTLNILHAIQPIQLEDRHASNIISGLVKTAEPVNLGDPKIAARYLSDFIKFLLRRISPESRTRSMQNLATKIQNLNELDIASKKTPVSASIGQSITLVKNVLTNQNPQYIREVLKEIANHLMTGSQ